MSGILMLNKTGVGLAIMSHLIELMAVRSSGVAEFHSIVLLNRRVQNCLPRHRSDLIRSLIL